MAFRLTHWAATVAAACVVLAVWRLPPEPAPFRWASATGRGTPEKARRMDLVREIEARNELLKRLRWADSIEAVMGTATGLTVVLPPGLPDALAGEVRRAAERAVPESVAVPQPVAGPRTGAAAGPAVESVTGPPAESTGGVAAGLAAGSGAEAAAGSDVVLGLFLMVDTLGGHPEWSGGPPRTGRSETYVGTGPERPYCATVWTYHGDPTGRARVLTDRRIADAGWLLGACRWLGRFGAPGSAVARWLEDGGYGLAGPLDPGMPDMDVGRKPFGAPPRTYTMSVRSEACLAGNRAACRDIFLNPMNVDTTLDRVTPTLTREGPVAHVESPFPDEAFAGLDRTILGALLTEFGPDSFRRFWTSDDDVGSAFQAAFGLPAGDWVHRWVTERLGVVEAGPGVAGADVLLSLVALGLAAAVGALVYRRQEVGGA